MHNSEKRFVGIDKISAFIPLRIAILIISDSRTLDTDTSGAYLADSLVIRGHQLVGRNIVKDDIMNTRGYRTPY